jgi:hypothetical protein
MKKKVLVLFSGTKSFEKVIDKHYQNVEYRGLDIDNYFEPHYNTDILKWDYRSELSVWQPDYIHASPICCEFTVMKNRRNNENESRDLNLGYAPLNRAWDIIQFVKSIKPSLLYTIENPVSPLFRKWAIGHKLLLNKASYCMYGFPYRKNTYFLSNINLNLDVCNKRCSTFFTKYGYHQVALGFNKLQYPEQITSNEYCTRLRKEDGVKYKPIHIRYRIPPLLIQSIIEQTLFK